jgi:hypothetical protein
MIDNFLHHFTGACGETHPTMYTMVAFLIMAYAFQKIRSVRRHCKERTIQESDVCEC